MRTGPLEADQTRPDQRKQIVSWKYVMYLPLPPFDTKSGVQIRWGERFSYGVYHAVHEAHAAAPKRKRCEGEDGFRRSRAGEGL